MRDKKTLSWFGDAEQAARGRYRAEVNRMCHEISETSSMLEANPVRGTESMLDGRKETKGKCRMTTVWGNHCGSREDINLEIKELRRCWIGVTPFQYWEIRPNIEMFRCSFKLTLVRNIEEAEWQETARLHPYLKVEITIWSACKIF